MWDKGSVTLSEERMKTGRLKQKGDLVKRCYDSWFLREAYTERIVQNTGYSTEGLTAKLEVYYNKTELEFFFLSKYVHMANIVNRIKKLMIKSHTVPYYPVLPMVPLPRNNLFKSICFFFLVVTFLIKPKKMLH